MAEFTDPSPRRTQLATLAYVRSNGQTLMLHRNKRPDDYHYGKWNGIGGKFAPGESPEECLRREVLEESGLIAHRYRWHGTITFPLFDGRHDWHVYLFTVTGFQGSLVETAEGTLAWIDDRGVLDLNLWPGDRIFLPWLNHPGFFSARFVYHAGQLEAHTVTWYSPNGEQVSEEEHPSDASMRNLR